MSREKTLNIHNTDRKFNLNLTTKQDEANFIKVTRLNEKQIENDMDRLKIYHTDLIVGTIIRICYFKSVIAMIQYKRRCLIMVDLSTIILAARFLSLLLTS
jgi:hypothetical protein